MSRSNSLSTSNPARFFAEWKSDKKMFQYWDKEIQIEGKEKLGANVDLQLPLRFLILDTLNNVRGYSDEMKNSFYSNEVRDIKKDELVVKVKGKTVARGLYDDIMGESILTGARFCKSVYIALRDEETKKLYIANLQLTGTALSAFIDFAKKGRILEGAVEISEFVEGKKGAVTFTTPVFTRIPVSPETDEEAKKLDVELQEYLTAYFKARKNMIAEETAAETPENVTEEVVTRSEQPNTFTPPSDEPLPF